MRTLVSNHYFSKNSNVLGAIIFPASWFQAYVGFFVIEDLIQTMALQYQLRI